MATKKVAKKVVEKEVIIDKKTTNKSFGKVERELKKAGVEDPDFIYALFNKDLIGKDPYSQRLQMEDVRNISNECEDNMWYYIRECLMTKKALDDGSMSNFQLTSQSMAAFLLVSMGYSIILDMHKAEGMRIANSIMLYFHQCGPRKHFEVIGKTDDDQYDLSENAAYYVTAPMYITSRMNFEPIYYETQEVSYTEFKYSKTGSYVYADQAFNYDIDEIEGAMRKWITASKKSILIITHDDKIKLEDENKELYDDIIENHSIKWDPIMLNNKLADIQKFKKKGFVVISK